MSNVIARRKVMRFLKKESEHKFVFWEFRNDY